MACHLFGSKPLCKLIINYDPVHRHIYAVLRMGGKEEWWVKCWTNIFYKWYENKLWRKLFCNLHFGCWWKIQGTMTSLYGREKRHGCLKWSPLIPLLLANTYSYGDRAIWFFQKSDNRSVDLKLLFIRVHVTKLVSIENKAGKHCNWGVMLRL